MQKQLTCPQGHSWLGSISDDACAAERVDVCPICGASALTLVPGDGAGEQAAFRSTLVSGRPAKKTAPVPVAPPGYEILGELGRGGMGVVYKARQISLKRIVALKMILAGSHASAELLDRFRGEAETIAKLQHPNIVQVYETGEYAGNVYCSLEFVEGGSLASKIAGTPQPPHAAAELLATLARAIDVVHKAGIVHRDLKPANILLRKSEAPSTDSADSRGFESVKSAKSADRIMDFVPKVGDFGLAKQLDTDSGQTKSGAILGTPSYMAPEQASGKVHSIGPHSDIYALGVVLYELLTGRPPFKGATPLDTITQVLEQDPLPPRRLVPKLPRDLETICLKCLEKDPAKRYATAGHLADDLQRFSADQTILARRPTVVDRSRKVVRRHRTHFAIATTGVALAVLFAWLSITWVRREQTRKLDELIGQGRQSLDRAGEAHEDNAAAQFFDEAAQHFHAALAIDGREARAHRGLFDVYWQRCQKALERGDYEVARVLISPLRNADQDGTNATAIADLERKVLGKVTWQVSTQPPGCDVTLTRLDAEGQPATSVKAGKTPLSLTDMAPGNYLLIFSHPQHAPARFPLLARHHQPQTVNVVMIPKGELPDGMVYVPAGEFQYGDPQSGSMKTVFVEGFFVDRTEVTGAQYEKFVRATGSPPPDHWDGWVQCPARLRDSAVYNVSWFQALEYARWAGKRLPTELEWEKAARGVDGRHFPWGDRFEQRRCNCRETALRGLEVDRRRTGASPYGCQDMAGNVWEWTLDREKPHETDRVIRGGAAYSTPDELLTFRRKGAPPGGSSYGGLNLLGFRCVKPLGQKPGSLEKPGFLDELTTGDDLAAAAEFYYDHERFETAEQCVTRLLKLNPRSLAGNFWNAALLHRAEKSAEALAAIKRVYVQPALYRTRSRELPDLRSLLPDVLQALEQSGKKVDRTFLDAPKWFPAAVKALDEKRYGDAERLLQKILAVDPANEVAHEEMAEVCTATNRPDQANNHRQERIAAYRLACAEHAHNPELFSEFAEFLAQNQNSTALLGEALQLAKQAVQLDQYNPAYRATQADLLFRLGRLPDAITAIKQAIELAPEDDSKHSYQEQLKTYQAFQKKKASGS